VAVSGLCPSDVRIYRKGSASVKPPIILGHEFAGYVYDVGPGVVDIKENEKVNVPADAYCGKCRMCRNHYENLCERPIAFGYQVDGAHADYALIPKRFVDRGVVFPLLPNVDFEEASMTEPLACSLNTIETLGARPGKTVAVIGDGPMGLLHVNLAKIYGADRIILVGLVDWKLKLGQELGATHLLSAREDVVKGTLAATEGAGADIVVVTAVMQDTIVQGLKMVSKRGYVSIFGGTPKGVAVQFEPNLIHYNETFLTGNSAYTYAHYVSAANLIASGKIQLKKLVTHHFRLDQIHDAIKVWDDKEKSMKIMLTR
jgi:L-iditol 2-dehydrogenase